MRSDAVLVHEPAERGAVGLEIASAHGVRSLGVDAELGAHELGHSGLHLCEEVAGMRVERVVEVEDPGLDLMERPAAAARACAHVPVGGSFEVAGPLSSTTLPSGSLR